MGVNIMPRQKAQVAKKSPATSGTGIRSRRAPQQAHRRGSHLKEIRDPKAPILSPCSLFGPDGQERSGWELRVGDMIFGRADSKESLLAYYTRIYEPLPTGHWRERAWQPLRRVARHTQQKDTFQEELPYEDDLVLESEALEAWD
jgi:hypothetical protein